jgi:hypothetical protein
MIASGEIRAASTSAAVLMIGTRTAGQLLSEERAPEGELPGAAAGAA